MKTRGYLFVVFLLLAGVIFFASRPAAQATSPEQLLIIGEKTGMVAADTALNAHCSFSDDYQVYLCPEADPATLPVPDPSAHARAMAMLQG